jgi:hypothetical protein
MCGLKHLVVVAKNYIGRNAQTKLICMPNVPSNKREFANATKASYPYLARLWPARCLKGTVARRVRNI